MLNELYCLLNNATVSDTSTVVAADLVPNTFKPVRAGNSIHSLWQALVSDELQARQYWICQMRRMIQRAFKQLVLTKFDGRQAYAVSDMQALLAGYFKPVGTISSGWRTSSNNWWAAEYQLKKLEVLIDPVSGLGQIYLNGNRQPLSTQSANSAGQYLFQLDQSQDLTLLVDRDTASGGFGLTWATRPRESLSDRISRIARDYMQGVNDLATSGSRLDAAVCQQLRAVVQSPAAGSMRAAAAGVLIAGHFAYLLDNR